MALSGFCHLWQKLCHEHYKYRMHYSPAFADPQEILKQRGTWQFLGEQFAEWCSEKQFMIVAGIHRAATNGRVPFLGLRNEHWLVVSDCNISLVWQVVEVNGDCTLETCNATFYWSLGSHSEVGKSTVRAMVMQVCSAINCLLLCRTLTLSNVQEIVAGFATMGFPNCRRATDSMYIPILAPAFLATKYINRKRYFSVVMHPLVNHWSPFTDVNVGCSGKCLTLESLRTQECSESCK